jgi:hypothetical protein
MRGDFFFDTNVMIYAVSKEDGRVIDDRLTIRNAFTAGSPP